MEKHIYQLTLLLIMILIGCKEKDPKLLEAFEIHKEAIAIGAKAVELCEKLPAGDTMRSKFEARLEDWGENVIEVPGFHYHHDGLGHHHGRPPVKMMPDDALIVQRELKDSIEAIYQRIQMHKAKLREQ